LKTAFSSSEITALRKELTVKPRFIPGYGVESAESAFPVYKENSTRLYIPKYFGLKRYGAPEVCKISSGDDIHPDVVFEGKIRPEQKQPLDLFYEACRDPLRRGGIISVGCGFGKTVMSIAAWVTLKKKALVIVHKDFLLKQWRERIEQYTPTARIGLIKQSKIEIDEKDIVLASLQSLSMRDYGDIFDSFGFVIIDEVHHCGAEVFSQALFKVNFQYALGLSATPTRKDGLTQVFIWSIGDIVFQSKRPPESVRVWQRKYVCSDTEYSEEQTMYNGKPNVSLMINQVCGYYPRTHWILEGLAPMYEEEPLRRVLVLSDRRQHLTDFEAGFKAMYPMRTVGYYVGGMKDKALKEAEACDILLGTYAMSSEGMDVPGLDTIILASPKSDVEQSVGRILRLKAEDRRYQALIIDIHDDIGVFANQARKRRAFYKKQSYEIGDRKEDSQKQNQKQKEEGDQEQVIDLTQCLFKK